MTSGLAQPLIIYVALGKPLNIFYCLIYLYMTMYKSNRKLCMGFWKHSHLERYEVLIMKKEDHKLTE